MRYQISGQQIDIGEALQNHVRNELNVIIQKYAERPLARPSVFRKMRMNLSVRRRFIYQRV